MPLLAIKPQYEDSRHTRRYTKLIESDKLIKFHNYSRTNGHKQVANINIANQQLDHKISSGGQTW